MKPMSSNDLPDDPVALKARLLEVELMLAALRDEHTKTLHSKEQRIQLLEEMIRLLRYHRFGAHSEKAGEKALGQGELFNEAEADDNGTAGGLSDDAVVEPALPSETAVPTPPQRKRGRKPLPAELPRVRIEHDLLESDKTCPCGCALSAIGEDSSEQLDIIPAQVRVLVHVRKKYACRRCENGVSTAALPPQPLPKSNASAGLLAHIVVAKYLDALPLHRQESIFNRIGVDLPRNTLAGWMIKSGQLVQPLLKRFDEQLLTGPLIQCDETPIQVLKEPGKSAQSKSYMWVQRGGPPGRRILRFHYHASRKGDVAQSLMAGYQGYLQTDDYAGYHAVGAKTGVTHLGCWAHARRKFIEVQKAARKKRQAAKANEALQLIGQLYGVEHEAKAMTVEQRYQHRQQKSLAVLQQLRDWLNTNRNQVLPKGLTGKAIAYLERNWDKLSVYTEDGCLPIDNNACENAIRPFVIGRKNWLFSATPKGADASAALYSLIETAKANGLEPWAYLQQVFSRLPAAETAADVDALLPWNVKGCVKRG